MESKFKELYNNINLSEQKSRKFRISIAALNGVLVYCMIVYALLPHKLDIQIGSTMPQTVYATKTVEDTVSTNEVKERVADQVPFQYTASEKVKQQQLEGFRSYYSAIINARNYAYENLTANDGGEIVITNSLLNQANNQFNTDLTMEQMNAVIKETQGDLLNYFKQADTELNNALTNGIYEGDVSKTREEIIKVIPSNKTIILNIVNTGLRKNMVANMLYDEQATATEKAKALENVETIYYPKGRAIAYKGEVVTESQFEMLNALGFVGKGISFDLQTIIGAAVLIIALYLFYYFYIYNYNNYVFGRLKYFALSSSVITITLAFCVLAMSFKEYLMPISLAGLLTVALINRKVALLNNIVVCGLVAIIQRNSWTFYSVFAYIISTMAGIYLFDRNKTRFGILLAGSVTAVMCFAVNGAYTLIAESLGEGITFLSFLAAYKGVISVAVSTILCLGLAIFFEEAFNIVTSTKLVDLSSTENHLLKEMIKKAPGTYHHSMMVANLAEGAAKAIGANSLLTRVGAYYHDVGKIPRSMYFKENQHDEINVHDSLTPIESAKIITGHTIEGYRLAQKEKLPREICDIILQHHGTTYAKFFYDKAIDMGMVVTKDEFSYPGPKPQTKEAAIIMLADTLEAIMRLGYDEDNAKNVIKKVIDIKIKEGQLDECDLSFKDLAKIIDSFDKTFNGMYHKRIPYKGDDKLLSSEKA